MNKGEKETGRLEAIARAVTVGLSVIALIWGGVSFLITKRIEARRPYLDYQLELYKETAKTAVMLVTSNDPVETDEVIGRFCELYWGELALVETPEVESQMVNFKRMLETSDSEEGVSEEGVSEKRMSEHDVCDNGVLGENTNRRREALRLAHVLRSSLADSWGVDDWEYKEKRP